MVFTTTETTGTTLQMSDVIHVVSVAVIYHGRLSSGKVNGSANRMQSQACLSYAEVPPAFDKVNVVVVVSVVVKKLINKLTS